MGDILVTSYKKTIDKTLKEEVYPAKVKINIINIR